MNIAGNFVTAETTRFFVLALMGNPAFLSVLGARLLFNMKEAGTKGLNEGRSCGSKSTVSDIEFEPPPEAAATTQSRDGPTEASEIIEI